MPSRNSIEFTLKTTCTGKHVLYVRTAVPDRVPGEFRWGLWRKANISERDMALSKLKEIHMK